MIEFGFGVGKSTKMWLEYFTKAKLITIDIRPEPDDKIIQGYIKSGRLEYVNASQIDKSEILKILEKYREFFIIIDDASHVPEDQQYTFALSFPYVVNGGWYVIEDLKCKRSHSNLFSTTADKTLVFLKNYKRDKKFESKILTKRENEYLTDNVENILIRDKIAFMRKKV
jgi:cephalosporin hydroxylase